ncbi:MAG: catechol 1,2-dioxygenase, partial [Bacteroidota bacterium]
VILKGSVRYNDCSTPFAGAKVELWHCSADEVYDNDSDEYRYRGTTYCDEYGQYQFTTQMPVPYDAGGGNYRPAHFHLMVSAPGHQSLITQLYFKGDEFLSEDESSASPNAKKRILKVKKNEADMLEVAFDVNLSDRMLAEPAAIKKLAGTYRNEKGQKMTFFYADQQLWMKNEVYGRSLEYIGDNTFRYPGLTSGRMEARFSLQAGGEVKATFVQEFGGEITQTEWLKKA